MFGQRPPGGPRRPNRRMGQVDPSGNPAGTVQPSNPFLTYNSPFEQQYQDPSAVFDASTSTGQQAIDTQAANTGVDPTAVSLPPHLFIPADAQSIDIRNLANIPPSTTVNLLEFTGLKGGLVKFIGYGIFNDALMFNLVNFVPLVNGVRVFPFHGNPQQNFKIALGTGADLSNANLIQCQLDIQPNDKLVWQFTNNDTVDVAAGVRMSGYYSQGIIRSTGRFGG